MKATLALLLSLCLVLVDVSFGDDNGNTDAPVTPGAGDTDSGKKCERKFPKPEFTNFFCYYKCKGRFGLIEKEDDGTPCKLGRETGKCKNKICVLEKSRISAPWVEPAEESAEPIEDSTEPTEETIKSSDGLVTFWPDDPLH